MPHSAVELAYQNDPRDYALELVEMGIDTQEDMLTRCLKYMSHDDVREMLDMNELSPRFVGPFRY